MDAAPPEQPDRGLDDPDQGDDGKYQRTPVDERVVLEGKDCPQTPRDGDARREITLRRGEGIGRCCALQEEEGEENKHLGPNVRRVGGGVNSERGKCGEEDEDSRPAVPE